MNFNNLIEEPKHEYLYNLFSKVLDAPLEYNEDKTPKTVVEVDNIKVIQPEHSFDFCYKYNISYAYTIQITCNVVDVETDSVIHTQILTVSFPKYYQNGFFFRTNKFANPKFRTPVIKCVSSQSVSAWDDVLILKLLDESTAYFSNLLSPQILVKSTSLGMYDEELQESDFDNLILHPTATLKLSYLMGRDVGNYLSFDLLKEIGKIISNEEGQKRFKTRYSIDYKYNTIEVSLLNSARAYSYSNSGMRRLLWTKYQKLYDSSVQSFINKSFSTGGDLGIITPDETNSVATESQESRMHFYTNKGKQMPVDYNNSFLNIVCPVDTPETNLINVKNEKTIGAKFKNGDAFISVYDLNWRKIDIPLIEFFTSKILISECVSYATKSIKDLNEYTCKYGLNSDLIKVSNLDEVKYIEREPYTRFSKAVSLVPGVNYTDQIKASLGAKMIGQATAVEGAEPPIVYTGTEGIIAEESSKVIKASVSGTVEAITDTAIIIKNDIGQNIEQYIPDILPLWDGTSIEYKPSVKIGQLVNEGDTIACSTEFTGGELAIGCNIKAGFMNFKGLDQEDSIIISKSTAEKFAIHRADSYTVPIYPGMYNFSKEAILNVYDESGFNSLENIDEFGLPKKDATFNEFDEMVVWASKPTPKNYLESLLTEAHPNDLDIQVKQFDAGVKDGKITNIEMFVLKSQANQPTLLPLIRHITEIGNVYESDFIDIKGAIAFIKISYTYRGVPIVGDKFSNRYASKGTISAILDDSEMPIDTADGKPLGAIFAPDSTAKRKNVNQIDEDELGKVGIIGYSKVKDALDKKDFKDARSIMSVIYQDETIAKLSDEDTVRFFEDNSIKGKALRIKQECIDHKYTPSSVGRIMAKLGISEKTKLYIPEYGKEQRNEVIVGNMYMMRLHFLANERSFATSDDDSINDEFVAGFGQTREGGQSISEMTLWALGGHSAMDVYDYLTKNVRDTFSGEICNNLNLLGLGIE